MASQQQVFRTKPSLKDATFTLLEGSAYGGVLIGADFVDDNQLLDKESLMSASSIVPIASAGIGFVGSMMTKGRAKSISRDIQLMSTPVAVFQLVKIAKKQGVFGKIFKKKASMNGDHFKNFGKQSGGKTQRKTSGLGDVSMSSIDMLN